MFGHAYFGAPYYGPSYFGESSGVAPVVTTTFDGGSLRQLRGRRGKKLRLRAPEPLHPEEIRRQQLEDERYLAEQEAKAKPASAAPALKAKPATATQPIEPALPDAIARAASAERITLTARDVAAQKAERRRRLALLLLVD